jgi:3-(3-hydroxy-phenyl)propionate hydroxylase
MNLVKAWDAGGYDADVLVVGLGPTGDVLSALLAQEGLSVIALDRDAELYPVSRAAVFDHEIMRIFQSIGVAEPIAAVCRAPGRYEFVTAAGDVLLDFELADHMPGSGWAETYVLHQPSVERVLRDRLAALGVDVRLGARLTSLTQDQDGVTCQVEGTDGQSTLRTRYMIGCDGASSRVREQLGIGLFNYRFDEPWLVLDATADTPGDLPQRLMQICDPHRPTTYLKMAANRYRWEFMIKAGEDPAELSSDAGVRRLLEPWTSLDRLNIERRAVYRFHGLVAEHWRMGRVLLAGDAAHQMPPFAGQGMCAGIRDAANLAWKLAARARGEADESLLDTYQGEREGHVRAVIEIAIAMGRVVCMTDPHAAAARDAEMLARKAAGERDIALAFPPLSGGLFTDLPGAGALFPQAISAAGRLDDQLGPGPWLIGAGAPTSGLGDVKVFTLDDPRIAPFSPGIKAWLDAHGVEAVLVRPDRHVFGSGEARDLLSAWTGLLLKSPPGVKTIALAG